MSIYTNKMTMCKLGSNFLGCAWCDKEIQNLCGGESMTNSYTMALGACAKCECLYMRNVATQEIRPLKKWYAEKLISDNQLALVEPRKSKTHNCKIVINDKANNEVIEVLVEATEEEYLAACN